MNFDAVTIERMVREVLNQTQSLANVRTSTALVATHEKLLTVPAAASTVVHPIAEAKPEVPTVVIRDRVVTADIIKEHAKPGSRIVIEKKAILTPAAQDFLRGAQISLERRDSTSAASSASTVRWKILLSSVPEHVSRAVDVIRQQRGQVQRELVGNAIEATSIAVSAIGRAEAEGVVVVTTSPDVVACRANRNAVVRAAVVTDLASWSRIQPQLQPNVVCISPDGRSFMELQNVLTKVVSSPAPTVPGDWS